MVLSDSTIARLLAEGRIEIDPYDPALLQPSSVDVRVDRYFRVFRNSLYPFIDVKAEQEELTELVEVDDEPFILHPGEFVLGSTLERVRLPDDLVARLEGKSLALDTPSTRPSQGWTTMGELRPGDVVFDGDGEPTRRARAPRAVMHRPAAASRSCCRDGTSVICDVAASVADRRQARTAVRPRRRSRVVTTRRDRSALSSARGERNHQIPLAGRVRYSDARSADRPLRVRRLDRRRHDDQGADHLRRRR